MKQLEAQEREQYVQVAVVAGLVIALALVVLFFFRKKE
jgi:LPXTG-motif cell wall-anchored protein